jgi:hypothetical protein
LFGELVFRFFGLLYLQACFLTALLAAGPAAAWSNHALATRPALAPLTMPTEGRWDPAT